LRVHQESPLKVLYKDRVVGDYFIEVGLLINFSSTGVDVKRKYRLREADDCFGPLFRSDPMQLIRQIL
jgi:hypothetical protein